jgi:TRAP-type C4-dicarboxylate transport system permease small subunit
VSNAEPMRVGATSESRLRARIDRAIVACGTGFILVAAMTLYDIAARYLFARPTIWALELSVLICAVLYLLCCIATTLEDAHIRIEVLERQVGRVVPDAVLSAISLVCSLIFLGGIAFGGYLQARNAILAGERSGTMLDSYAPTILKTGIPVMAVAMALIVIGRALRRPKPR